jgi:hypothetical protein
MHAASESADAAALGTSSYSGITVYSPTESKCTGVDVNLFISSPSRFFRLDV